MYNCHRLIQRFFGLFLLNSVLLLSSANANDQPLVKPFLAQYNTTIKGISATATRRLHTLENGVQELHFSAQSWMATMTEVSQFSWQDARITPIHYRYEHNILGKNQQQHIAFNANDNSITGTHKGQPYTLTNDTHTLDKLSYQLQLQQDLLNSTSNTPLSYHITDRGKLKYYRLQVIDRPVLNTRIGKLNTLKIKVIRDNSKRATTLWLASDWDNLLVKLEHYSQGDKAFELELTHATIQGHPITGLP